MDEELRPYASVHEAVPADAARLVAERAAAGLAAGRMPALYMGHGAPPLVDDPLWVTQLSAWAQALPRPRAILVVSAHWEAAPLTIGATRDATPLVYDFYGFPERYYLTKYPAPGAPGLAAKVRGLLAGAEVVNDLPDRGLDHGAYVPLTVMYPAADVPVLQISMSSLDPTRLLNIGARLRPLRDEGVLIVGSGFITHGLPYLRDHRFNAPPPAWSVEFDHWAAEALDRGDIDTLAGFRTAPAARYAHPTSEHFAPLFVTLGAADDPAGPPTPITGYWLGLAKRSIQVM
ncbi:MAG TPA: class III extradiol ring-cleavage dioxygenase [Streptosporangiaceae bacterium]|nr:class III extradiol ring-cleavage dioxygenase [Streptosporangiaceae bacterium]